MEIIINQRMRELRRVKKNTQEQLAEHLGVSIQAVSKWERGEGFPDISLLPGIAAYYNVSVDTLLGVDADQKQKRIAEYLKKSNGVSTERQVGLWRQAYQEFPNEPTVLHHLCFALKAENLEKNSDQIIPLAEKLLRIARQSGEYFGAINNLCRAYAVKGDLLEAKRYAAMAGRYIGTENQLLIRILNGEAAAGLCQSNILDLVDLIQVNADVLTEKGELSILQQINISEQVLEIYRQVFCDGNFGFYHCRMVKWHLRCGKYYGHLQNREKALNHLGCARKHAEAFDSLKEGYYTAPLIYGYSYCLNPTDKSQMEIYLAGIADEFFDFIRDEIV